MHRPRRLPPLHMLPAFEAAARHESFRAAAAELHLTPSAISHQIRALEEALGLTLFQRLARGLVLTEAGRTYAKTVREVLDRLEGEAEQLGSAGVTGKLRISMPDFIAQFHVLPKLAGFRALQPHINLEISTNLQLSDIEGGEVDAAIRLGHGIWGTLHSYPLSRLVASVIGTPELAAKIRKLGRGAKVPAICIKNLERFTDEILAQEGLVTEPSRTLCVDSCLAVLESARAGLGVAVIYHSPEQRLEPSDRLVLISNGQRPAPFAMYFVCRRLEANRPDICALRDWLFQLESARQAPRANAQRHPAPS
jgi:LysR family transcriptional regulator, glycine cleavage system transcriptional activator